MRLFLCLLLALSTLHSASAWAQTSSKPGDLRFEFRDGGQTLDQTAPPSAAPNFSPALTPNHGLSGYSSAPVTPPPGPSALWTYNGISYYTTCPGLCDAIGTATCSGSACPVSSCQYYCTFNPFSGEGCGAPGTVTTSSPSQMGFLGGWPFGNCGA